MVRIVKKEKSLLSPSFSFLESTNRYQTFSPIRTRQAGVADTLTGRGGMNKTVATIIDANVRDFTL